MTYDIWEGYGERDRQIDLPSNRANSTREERRGGCGQRTGTGRHTLRVVILTHVLFILTGIKYSLLQHVQAKSFRFHQ